MTEAIFDAKQSTANIRKLFENYLTKSGLKSVVVGESGGIDSALTTVLARPVCHKLGVKLIGCSIPIETNTGAEISRAKDIGEAFADVFIEKDLTSTYLVLKEGVIFPEENADDYACKIRLGNIKARMRMMFLYHTASLNSGMVMSTDNLTELLLGFWTLHGDVGDYSLFQYLWKHEVYELANYLLVEELTDEKEKAALKACIDAQPMDGLGITNTDLDQLGAATYHEVDLILKRYLKLKHLGEDIENELLSHAVVQRHVKSQYKRENPYNEARELITNASMF
ncbi:MAG: NAD(+) synthase [Bacteroidales bacterium]